MMISKAPPSSLLQSRCYCNCNRDKQNNVTIALTTATNDKKNRQEQNPPQIRQKSSIPPSVSNNTSLHQSSCCSVINLPHPVKPCHRVVTVSAQVRMYFPGLHCSHGPRPTGSPGQLVIYSSATSRTDIHGSL